MKLFVLSSLKHSLCYGFNNFFSSYPLKLKNIAIYKKKYVGGESKSFFFRRYHMNYMNTLSHGTYIRW